MKIKCVQNSTYDEVTTDELHFCQYRRFSSEAWEVSMGMSWETVQECSKLEEEYQKFVND